MLYPVLGAVAGLAVLAVCVFGLCLLRRRNTFTPKQPLPPPAEEEKRPLNGTTTIDCTQLGGGPARRPPQPFSIVRHA